MPPRGGFGSGEACARGKGRKGFRRARPSRPRARLGVAGGGPAGGVGDAAGSPGGCHGFVTGEAPKEYESVTRLASREGDAGNVTLPCVLDNTDFRAA
jgi:hypothetical protein